MSLNKFIQDPDEKPFHTSGYAEAANKGNIGSTSQQTFSQRARIDENRRSIRKYRDSMIARQHAQRHRFTPKTDIGQANQPAQNSRQAANATPQNPPSSARQSFQEPTTKKFNPYG